MLKSYTGLLSLVCCLLLVTAFALPAAAQTSTSSDSNQNLSNQNNQTSPTPSTPSDVNTSTPSSGQINSDPDRSNSDVDRQKPTDTTVQPDQGKTGTTPSGSDQYATPQTNTERESGHVTTDRDRDRDTSTSSGTMNSSADSGTAANRKLPSTASGIPLTGLIGAVSMFGFAIRRWL